MPEEQKTREEMKEELARLLASLVAEDGSEMYRAVFTNDKIPILLGSEMIEVFVRRVHKVTRPKPRIVVTTMPEPVYI